MSRDFWLTKREAVKIDKIKKSLTISADSFDCGPVNSSIQLGNNLSPIRPTGAGTQPLTLSATTITLDFWAYIVPTITVASWGVVELEEASGYGIKITTTTSTLTVSIVTSAATYTITYPTPWYQWKRYTVAVDTANNIAKFYLDGVEVGSVAVAAGSFSTTTFDLWFGDSVFLGYLNGYLQDIALYNVYKNANAVDALKTHKGTTGTYSGGLTYYWKLRGNLTNTVGGIDLTGGGMIGGPTYSTNEYAPIKFGASFIAAQYSISLTQKNSFLFPNDIPEGCTGMLVVRWIDDGGEVQRRRFWDLDGVDINPLPEYYNGESISEDFYLEWWNIDGQATIEVPDDVVLRMSKTTHPTTSYDSTPESAATLSVDTTLAQAFALTPFPLTFNTQQTY